MSHAAVMWQVFDVFEIRALPIYSNKQSVPNHKQQLKTRTVAASIHGDLNFRLSGHDSRIGDEA